MLWLAATLALADVIVPKSVSPDIVDSTHVREDVEAGRRAEATFKANELREARERRLRFDRAHLREHRQVLALFRKARSRYDRARGPRALKDSREAALVVVTDIRRRMDEMDHWRNNSRVFANYDALLHIITDEYPAALAAAARGDGRPLAASRASFDAQVKEVRTWLAEAAKAVDEDE